METWKTTFMILFGAVFKKKKKSLNITHSYSFITRVLLAVLLKFFPTSSSQKSTSSLFLWLCRWLIPFFGGGWTGGGGGKKCRLAGHCTETGRFPICLAWIAELPHRTWQLLTPTRGCVCLCLFVIYWCLDLTASSCLFACQASKPPPTPPHPPSPGCWSFPTSFVIFCMCECSCILVECILHISCLAPMLSYH